MTYQVLANASRETVLVIARGPATVSFIKLEEAGLTVQRADAESFDRAYNVIPTTKGHLSTPQDYARWALNPHSAVGGWPPADPSIVGTLVWLLAVDGQMFVDAGIDRPPTKAMVRQDGTYLGSFIEQDLPQVKRAYDDAHGLNLSPSDAKTISAVWHDALRHSLGLAPAKPSTTSVKEIMMAAKAAKKPAAPAKPKKAEKTTKERSGIGAKLVEYLTKNAERIASGKLTRPQVIEWVREQGCTAKVDGRIATWCRENGVSFVKQARAAEPKPSGKGKESGAATKAANAKAKAEGKKAESAKRGADFAEKMKAARAAKKQATSAPKPGETVAAS